MSNVADVTDATFTDTVVKSAKPVLVDYWADWCSPCKQLSPIVDELAAEHGDKITFVKMDTNSNTQVPASQGIMSLPTLQLWVGGEVVKSLTGAKSKAALVKALDEYL
ncbi:thioredoxin [Aestuariimicrobium sp. p3-SID1156]|uniref:thioredoxin n=1 Tax=Aestuariimicrobium sp. p3-SID1156 TaxID=2916038 RepID=UPI00223AA612|nr:thioredoxin [Aestuariimicrobium sp. p3-SID1156]MCT1458053.1 thioredoxin [Aestuariimicrobium sp. p3-SID1156]